MENLHELERTATASNNVLTNVEKYAIQSLIQGAQKDLDDADAELSRVLAIRETKFARVVQLKGTISVIRELPNEVIAEIFSHIVSETVNIDKPIDRSFAPWNISQVCSRWRGVAVSVPTLWNDMAVNYSLADDYDQRILTQKLGKFLSRGGQAPISLHVCAKPPAHLPTLLPRLTKILAPHQDRVRHLGLEPAESIPYILDVSQGLTKSVRSLELVFHTDLQTSILNGVPPPNILSPQFPALQKVTLAPLTPFLVYIYPEVFHLPWAQLTYLWMDSITFCNSASYKILRQCHNLVTCSLELQNDVGLQPEDLTVMPHLETLRVVASVDRGAYGHFFKLLRAPMLRELTLLSGLCNDIVWSDKALAAFISHTCVQRLVTTASIHKLPTLLQRMPSLLHLISNKPIDSSNLAAISSGRLFPQLETLVCGGFPDFNEIMDMADEMTDMVDEIMDMYDKMMGMLEHRSWYSRTTGNSDEFKTLKSMTYCVPRIFFLSNTCQERLKKLQADGLHVDCRDEKIDISEFDLNLAESRTLRPQASALS